ncbi:PQQ-dependent sugar dehydrogenase [Luteolibacter arcticus]|uniref:PQQ-dependent sugar dehydrogenase n=1 Tax=Luteolibacter arcticus TaxID=1581411 RepID=UPI0022219DDA|nr:PQQ-dependent sugar dehydrogenase [Luteolibacter arcticus]
MRQFLLPLLGALACGLLVPALAQVPDAGAYRRHALSRSGDALRGKAFFNDERLLCAHCHSVDGSSSKAGPDLFAAGDAFGRRDLIESVLKPSATIAPGYGAVIVQTKAGTAFQGTLKQKNDEGVQIMGVDGKLVSIAAADIKEQSGLTVSLMPEGLHVQLTTGEFTDLIEYLTTLKQAEATLASDRGMPLEIPVLAKPVTVRPFFAKEFKLPRGRAESGLTSLRAIPGSPGVFMLLHQGGTIWQVTKTATGEESVVFANLSEVVFSERGPNGLLDVAFHPKFRENRRYYLFYQTLEEGEVVTRIVEKKFGAGSNADSGEPPRVILKIASVAEDHSGGCLEFGPDGFLYLVMGDTGPHHDPNGHAQNLDLLLGKVMRIDVDREEDGRPYAIPPDNPFVGKSGVRPEIWAYGFRNPWRFSFDRRTGDLWLADVGQDRLEEVAIVRRGENHGWNVFEGFEPFSSQYRKEDRTFTRPVFAYRRKFGNSITGGHVYRGSGNPSFQGVYVFADYTSKIIFGITLENGVLKTARQIGVAPQRIVSFCEDEAGELYVVGYEGMISRIDFSGAHFE